MSDTGTNTDPAPTNELIGLAFGELFDHHAATRGSQPAITLETNSLADPVLPGQSLTFDQLNRRSNQMARHLQSLGVVTDDFVTIAEPNSIEWIVAAVACWKLGATPQPVSSRLPKIELDAIVELAEPRVVIGTESSGVTFVPRGFVPDAGTDHSPLPHAIAKSWKAPTSGGSTGRPKLIVAGDPSVYSEGLATLGDVFGAPAGQTMVVPGPMYHNGPLVWSFVSLLAGAHVSLLPRFDAAATLAAVQTHRATGLYLVPTMMHRIWKLPDDTRLSYDLSSLNVAFHLAEPCPRWLKHEWIEWLGPEVIWELYGGTEGQSWTVVNGTDWLEHPGTVGTCLSGEIVIRDADGNDLGPGELGDIWMRPVGRETPSYHYLGAEAETADGGWDCLGDVGWKDADGFLFLGDRRSDMILVGGANIFPAEVEAAINAHPLVGSSAVIGLPDDERGSRVHAIVEAAGVTDSELKEFLGDRLVSYKLPRSFEYVTEPLRDDAGKVRRSALRAERLADVPTTTGDN